MAQPSPPLSDGTSSETRHDYPWQDNQTGQESVPFRDIAKDGGTLERPLNTERRISEGEGCWDDDNRKPMLNPMKTKLGVMEERAAGEVRKHMLGLWLMIFYGAVAILSWAITCVLCYKPIGIPTYFDQVGNYSRSQYERSDRWREAAKVGFSIVTVVSIPVTSAICAKAAAISCQRSSDAKTPPLTLRQMLALADKGWADIGVLWDLLRPSTSRKTRSPLLILSAALVGIALLISPLHNGFVNTVHIKVLSTQDSDSLTQVGPQVGLTDLIEMSNGSMVDSIIATTVNAKLSDKQPYLWSTGPNKTLTSLDANLQKSPSLKNLTDYLFTTTVPVGTDTGVFRNLALRLNASVNCMGVARSNFPSFCPGANPLSQTFSNINDSSSTPFSDYNDPRYRVRICAPGDITVSPWQSTTDRQDVYEEFWLDFQRTVEPTGYDIEDYGSGHNYTQHCHGNSTLGYFELPNYWNNFVASDLLNKVPPQGRNLSYRNARDVPGKSLWMKTGGAGIPSPFLTALVAVFGPNTFFSTVASNSNYTYGICSLLRIPFTGVPIGKSGQTVTTSELWNQGSPLLSCLPNLASGENNIPFLQALFDWLCNFGDDFKATAALDFATYAASNAILNIDEASDWDGFIYTGPGSDLQKPTMPLAIMISITVLLALQLAGMAYLAIYASRHPSWTASLDAWAMLRIGAEIGRDVPAVSALEARRASILDEKEGWVGDAGVEWGERGSESRQLVLGGTERVRRGAMYRTVRDKDSGEHEEIISALLK